MKKIAIIPSRYASVRFPGKPLVDIKGTSMVMRVYHQARQSLADEVWIATDDERIYAHASDHGAPVKMTSNQHQTGTERCCEVAAMLNLQADDIVINVQGDEPFIHPLQINQVIDAFNSDRVEITTLIRKIRQLHELRNNGIPKVMVNRNQEAVYFSRSVIPHYRQLPESEWLMHHQFFRHIGIYGYRYRTLRQLVALPESPWEKAEQLEQLRWLYEGFAIRVKETEYESHAVDTPDDLKNLMQVIFGHEQ